MLLGFLLVWPAGPSSSILMPHAISRFRCFLGFISTATKLSIHPAMLDLTVIGGSRFGRQPLQHQLMQFWALVVGALAAISQAYLWLREI